MSEAVNSKAVTHEEPLLRLPSGSEKEHLPNKELMASPLAAKPSSVLSGRVAVTPRDANPVGFRERGRERLRRAFIGAGSQPLSLRGLTLKLDDPYEQRFHRPEQSFSQEEVCFIMQTGHPHFDLSGVDYRRGYYADYSERKKEALELAPRGEWVKDALEGAAFSEGVLPAEEGLSPKAAEIVPTDQGKSGTYFVKNKKGEIVAVFKPYDEDFGGKNPPDLRFGSTMPTKERPADGVQPGQNAAFECSGRAIFLEYFTEEGERCLVPETVHATLTSNAFSTKGIERDISPHHLTKQGSLQRFIQGRSIASFEPHQAIESIVNPKELERMMAYDLATGSTDRNAGNALVTEDRHLVMIDQAIMCSEELDQRTTAFWYRLDQSKKPFSKDIEERIRQIDPDEMIALAEEEFHKARGLLSPEERDFLHFTDLQKETMRHCIFELQSAAEVGLTPYDIYWLRAQRKGIMMACVKKILKGRQNINKHIQPIQKAIFEHAAHLRLQAKYALLEDFPDLEQVIDQEISYSHINHRPFLTTLIQEAVYRGETLEDMHHILELEKDKWVRQVALKMRVENFAKERLTQKLKELTPSVEEEAISHHINRAVTYLSKELASQVARGDSEENLKEIVKKRELEIVNHIHKLLIKK